MFYSRNEWELIPLRLVENLMGSPRLHNYRMFGLGVIPEYHGKEWTADLSRPARIDIHCGDVDGD